MADTSTLCFPHELDALSFPVGTAEVSVSVSMPSRYGTPVTLLSGTFAGDGEGVRVDGLAAMIRAQQRSYWLRAEAPDFPISFNTSPYPGFTTLTVCPQPGIAPEDWESQWGGDVPVNPATKLPYTYSTYPVTYNVLPDAPDLPYTCAEWADTRFLTPAACKRMPCHPYFERLAFLAELGARFIYGKLTVIWFTPARQMVTYDAKLTARLGASSGKRAVYLAGFRPSLYTSSKDVPEAVRGLEPSVFVAQFGSRVFTYHISSGAGNDCFPRPLVYLTGFGLLDRFWCYGEVTTEWKPSYTASAVRGLTRNAAADVTPSEVWHTGAMAPGELPAAHDLALSTMIFDGETGEELTLTESEIKTTNDRTQAKAAAFTLRRAKPGANAVRRAAKTEGKVFDTSYDDTYE